MSPSAVLPVSRSARKIETLVGTGNSVAEPLGEGAFTTH
jgi:hypothetical protein